MALPSRLEGQDPAKLVETSRRLLADLQALSTRIAAVNEIATAINRSLDLNRILQIVGEQAKWLLDFEYCSVTLVAMEGEGVGANDVLLFGSDDLAPDRDVIERALKSKQPQLAKGEIEDGRLRAQMVLPLEAEGVALGSINFVRHTQKAYTQEDLRIAYMLALQLASAIRNARRFHKIEDLYGQLEISKKASDDLLRNVLPESVAVELREHGKVVPVHYEMATVLFTDFVGFTPIAAILPPEELLRLLDDCFTEFDHIIEQYGLEKLKTIGDSYMCVAGVPTAQATHAVNGVRAALAIQAYMLSWAEKQQARGLPTWQTRIGLHSGSLIAGVIGQKRFAYDVWGDTVNTAARIESNSQPDEITITEATYQLVRDYFVIESRGVIDVKGKGAMTIYAVKGELDRV
ncbi:MAG TPA: adenylate/guanylate cyclase domain-containing protein [Anaerolineae bacterium]|nr:adenylate/guanylate cyclase domain-containing protein [Anaerolineae bacterium]